MKVFLLKDIKGKGKAGETIEVKNGYAQFLIKEDKAIDFESNKAEIHKIIEAKLVAENDALQLAYNIADDLSKIKLNLSGKLSPKGSLVNKITKNDIIDALPNELKINVDKKMLLMDNINTIGTFEIPVKLHKQVTGKLRVIISGD